MDREYNFGPPDPDPGKPRNRLLIIFGVVLGCALILWLTGVI